LGVWQKIGRSKSLRFVRAGDRSASMLSIRDPMRRMTAQLCLVAALSLDDKCVQRGFTRQLSLGAAAGRTLMAHQIVHGIAA